MAFRRLLIAGAGMRTAFGAATAGGAACATIAYAARCEGAVTGVQPMVFFSDLDKTLVGGDADGLKAWSAYWEAEERLKHKSVLCYNTGRCIADFERELAPLLPVPDVLICGDGLEVRWCSDREHGKLQLDEEWEQRIRHHWDDSGLRERVIARMQPLDEGLIDGLNDAANSPPRGEARWAITVRGAEKARALARELEETFNGAVISYAMKGWDAQGLSYVVVVLPAISGKANAAKYVQARLGAPDVSCVAAGDSENDATMLGTPYAFVAVSNASPGLVEALDAAGAPERHVRVEGACAYGVIEGLRHLRRTRLRPSTVPVEG